MSRTEIADTLDIEQLKPINDYVLLRVLERSMTAGGIHLIEKKQELCIGEVVAVGPGVPNAVKLGWFPIELKKGDIVVSLEWMGDEKGSRIDIPSGKYRLIRSAGIWAKATFKDRETLDLATIEPRMDCVLLDLDQEAMTRSGLIHLVHGNRESGGRLATVVAVGPGVWHSQTGVRIPIDLKPGEQVIMMRHGGGDILVNGRTLRILQVCDVYCGETK